MMDNKPFDISASVVFRLGEELISDEIQALVELIKNAYDADATKVNVVVKTKERLSDEYIFAGSQGYIFIEDNGTGMSEQIIDEGWLFLSNSSKGEMKRQNQTTIRGRTPLGDKGLGRLGVQRLGWEVEIVTRPRPDIRPSFEPDIQYQVGINWREFATKNRLSEVRVPFIRSVPTREYGTTLTISSLRNTEIWDGNRSLDLLQVELSRMISPFKRIRDFSVVITVNGTKIELARIAEEVRATSPLRYTLNFDSDVFLVEARAKLSYIKPSTKDQALFNQIVEADNGKAFRQFMLKNKRSAQFDLKSAQAPWFVEFGFKRKFADFDRLAKNEKGELANPGPFEAEIDFFSLQNAQQSVFDRLSDYRQYIKDLSGIRVYRDGFNIRVDEDWLGLRSSQTSAPSVYVLRPDNTIGYIALSSARNSKLRETTDREGFVKDAYYINFFEMLRQFLTFSSLAQEFIRRGWLDFRKEYSEKYAEKTINQPATPENIVSSVQNAIITGKQIQNELKTNSASLKQLIDNRNRSASTTDALTVSQSNQVQDLLKSIEKSVLFFQELEERAQFLDIINEQITRLRDQISLTYETVSLGLTAEALSHEIKNVIAQLLYRTDKIRSYAITNGMRDLELISYIDYVRSSSNSLRRQLAHLNPSLRYVREARDEIKLSEFFVDLETYYKHRFSSRKLDISINVTIINDFVVQMNLGKLTQVMDNLVLNSEYWLENEINVYDAKNNIIFVEIDSPFIRVWDNGKGIEHSVETSIFEPFVTAKQSREGRGLGLFIVQQLLDSEDCTINLLNSRNQYNRLYIFEINLFSRITL